MNKNQIYAYEATKKSPYSTFNSTIQDRTVSNTSDPSERNFLANTLLLIGSEFNTSRVPYQIVSADHSASARESIA